MILLVSFRLKQTVDHIYSCEVIAANLYIPMTISELATHPGLAKSNQAQFYIYQIEHGVIGSMCYFQIKHEVYHYRTIN
jgi:hypothetical protein